MNNSKILKKRQFLKSEALNQIRKICNPKYKFPYSQIDLIGDWYDYESKAEERESKISNIIKQLEKDLKKLKVTNNDNQKAIK